jgi:hypothetical protein
LEFKGVWRVGDETGVFFWAGRYGTLGWAEGDIEKDSQVIGFATDWLAPGWAVQLLELSGMGGSSSQQQSSPNPSLDSPAAGFTVNVK